VLNGSGVNLTLFSQKPVPPDTSFLLIGRLIKSKGVLEYVEAARIVKTRHPNAKFYLAGWVDGNPDSILNSDLEKWVRDDWVHYLGDLRDVRSALEKCSVYVLPSYREGTPRSVLEAMGVGRAIITTDAPGCRETVEDGVNGFLVPGKSVASLASAMEKFLDNPLLSKEMGIKSRKIAEEKYNVHDVNNEILEGIKTSISNDNL